MPYFVDKTGKTIGESLNILASLAMDYNPDMLGKSD